MYYVIVVNCTGAGLFIGFDIIVIYSVVFTFCIL